MSDRTPCPTCGRRSSGRPFNEEEDLIVRDALKMATDRGWTATPSNAWKILTAEFGYTKSIGAVRGRMGRLGLLHGGNDDH